MKTITHYSVAGLTFRVVADSGLMDGMQAFEPFKTDGATADLLFKVAVDSNTLPTPHFKGKAADAEMCNDFGKILMYEEKDRYYFEVTMGEGDRMHTMTADRNFALASICLDSADIWRRNALSAMLHILFSMAILPKGGIMTHASCVMLDGKGYMFLGKSGTGKSTHASLWMRNFAGCSLLNDDNPVIRIIDEECIQVYGTPWSGKTPCYKNAGVPLRGIVRLEQAPANQYLHLRDTAAFTSVLPSCSAIHSDDTLRECLYKSVIKVCERISIGLLRCRPDKNAAVVCHDALSKIKS